MVYRKRKSDSAEWVEQKRLLEFMEKFDLKCRHVAILLNQKVDTIYKYRMGLRKLPDDKWAELKQNYIAQLLVKVRKVEEL